MIIPRRKATRKLNRQFSYTLIRFDYIDTRILEKLNRWRGNTVSYSAIVGTISTNDNWVVNWHNRNHMLCIQHQGVLATKRGSTIITNTNQGNGSIIQRWVIAVVAVL